MKNTTKNIFSDFLKPLPLYDDFNHKHGYEFMTDDSLPILVRDLMLTACRSIDCVFTCPDDKELFLSEFKKSAHELCEIFKNELHSEDEMLQLIIEEAESISKTYGMTEEKLEIRNWSFRYNHDCESIRWEAFHEMRENC